MHWVNKSGFQEKNMNISTIRFISYQSEKQCFSLQYNPYIIFLQRRFDFEPYLYKRNAHLAAAAAAAAARSQVVCSTFTYAKQVCSSSHSVSQETCVSASMLFLHSLQWCQHTWQALIDFYSLFYIKLNRLLPKAVTGNHQIVFEILICIRAE